MRQKIDAPAPADIYAGSQVRMQRLLRRMSQTALADRLGVTFQQVQKYEKGTNRISSSRLQNICRILNVPIATFFAEDGADLPASSPGTSPVELVDFLGTKLGVSLNKAFLLIKEPDIRQSVLALAKAVAEASDKSRVV